MRLAPLATALAAVLLASAPACAQDVSAITRPCEDVTLSFVRAGRISEMLVKEGDTVKAGQVIARLDDEAEKAQLAQLKAQADDTVRVRAAEAQLEQKKVEYGKLLEAFEKKAVSKWDVERAKVEVAIGDLSLELAKFNREQDRLKYEELRIQIERMKIASPIDGKVEKVSLKAGEAANENEDVIRIVKVDPLWIEAPVPLKVARALKVGESATVNFLDGAAPSGGKIVYINAVADAASDTLNVRVEVPNAAGRPAGEHVTVRFRP